jgi:hypothetical protein
MSSNTDDVGNTPSEQAAPDDLRGAIWQGSTEESEEVHFHWVDSESGDCLELRVEGDEGFLSGLEDLGFVRREAALPKDLRKHANETPRRNSNGKGPHPGWQGRRGA